MPNQLMKQITVPVEVDGVIQNVTYDVADAAARARIAELGQALYWIGVTTTALTDGDTTNPITVGGESVTAEVGGIASYSGTEFAWNGSAWQMLAPGNLGTLAYQNSASGSYTPAGSVNVTAGTDTTGSVTGITNVGSLPSFSYDSTNEALTFSAGTLPTADSAKTFVTASGTPTAAFVGTADTITVS